MMRTVDFFELVDTAWRRIGLPLFGLLAGLAAAQAVTPMLPQRYEAHASVLVVASPPEGDRPAEMSLALAQNLAPTVAKLIGSREVSVAAARDLGLPEQAVIGSVSGTFEPGLQIVTVRAEATAAGRAAAMANAVSQNLGGQLERLELGGDAVVTTRVVDRASPPSRPASPKPLMNSALGALVGLLAGWGASVLRDRFDRRLRDVGQMELRLGLPVLGVLPQLPRRFARHHAAALLARRDVTVSTRATVSSLSVLTNSAKRRLLVTSANDDDGSALVTALLGLSMAADQRRVTIVEGAVRDPVLAGHFPDASFTWQQVQAGQHSPARLPDLPTLSVLPSEPRDGLTTEHVRDLSEVLDMLADTEDCVIVHAPPVLAGWDTAALAGHVDGVLLVVAAGDTRLTEATRAARLLRRLDLPLVGIVALGAIDRATEPAADNMSALHTTPGATTPYRQRRSADREPRSHQRREAAPGGQHRTIDSTAAADNRTATAAAGPAPTPAPSGDTTVPVDHLPPLPPRQPHHRENASARWRVAGTVSPLDDGVAWSTPLIAGGREAAGSALGRPLAARTERSGRTYRTGAGPQPVEPVPDQHTRNGSVTPHISNEALTDLDDHHASTGRYRWPIN
jgi:capsular polysaccharide biosynthesis protein/Mrp family chromosome partitioning ATPase